MINKNVILKVSIIHIIIYILAYKIKVAFTSFFFWGKEQQESTLTNQYFSSYLKSYTLDKLKFTKVRYNTELY